ncbi:MAG: transglutaminase domain-containing protein [Candidatus Omnitrophica bacterium]|nr:transglutaminase domain-containing protein [Candidatus Omnitrophota bacterium]
MKRQDVQSLISLISAWSVYAVCQNDLILPFICTLILLFSAVRLRAKSKHIRQTQPETIVRKISWINHIGIFLLIGWAWRTVLPKAETLAYATNDALLIMQSGLVMASLAIWFRKKYLYRHFALQFMSWGIVALSINVKFHMTAMIVFCLFCVIHFHIIMLNAFTFHQKYKNEPRYNENSLNMFFHYFIILFFSFGLSIALISFVEIGDRVYMSLMRQYLIPMRHYMLNLSPKMRLQPPGYSGRDVRPVLEIDRTKQQQLLYLTTQVFENYDNGVWSEKENVVYSNITSSGPKEKTDPSIYLFYPLRGVLPSPANVLAVKSTDHDFEQDPYGIVYSADPGVLKAAFHVDNTATHEEDLSEQDRQRLIELHPLLREQLRLRVPKIISRAGTSLEKALQIQNYFHTNFEYSLDANLKPHNGSVLKMLDQRSPAYCSWFATSMALLLRQQNIPSRIRVGFVTSEQVNDGKQFIARVRDAHAWVEAYLPLEGQENRFRWVAFDPTPAAARFNVLNHGEPINPITDWILRHTGKLKSEISAINTTKTIVMVMSIVLIFLIIHDRKQIWQSILDYLARRKNLKNDKLHRKQDCLEEYLRFENYIFSQYQISRELFETNGEFLRKIQSHDKIPEDVKRKAFSFIHQYQHIRFGTRDAQIVFAE